MGSEVGSAVLSSGFVVSFFVVCGNTALVVTVSIIFGVVLAVVFIGSVLSVIFSVGLVVVSETAVVGVVTGKDWVVGDVVGFEVLIVVSCDVVDDVISVDGSDEGSGEGSGEGVFVVFDSGLLSFPREQNPQVLRQSLSIKITIS